VKAVYADTSPTHPPHTWQGSKWDSGDLTTSGQSYTYRFTSTGTFSFYCYYHQTAGMTGTVTVR
jgi:plastocyanin